jgi:predicted phosphodiesterase
MRLAIFSDVHGNPVALDAVLADAEAMSVGGYLALGDYAYGGPDPSGAVERLRELHNASFVRGNTEWMLAEGQPVPLLKQLRSAPEEAPRQVDFAATAAWAHGHLTARGQLTWLATLPKELRLVLPDGTCLLAVHAAPGSDGSDGRARCVTPGHTDDALRVLLQGCEADLVCVGHTHWPLDRMVDGVRVINVGSVSNPWAEDIRACYVLLEADPVGYRVEERRVAYDVAAVLAGLELSGQPGAEALARSFRSERWSNWPPIDVDQLAP